MALSSVAFLGLTFLAGSASAASVDRAVSIQVPGATLQATLSVPQSVFRPPVVLILAGSGPTDRDGNSPAGINTDAYKKLAAALNTAGFAVLRPDKRGIGASLPTDRREEALTFTDYVNDASAWIRWLSTQPSLGSIGVVGHSEGALVGLAAVLKTPVQAYVSLAGTGENIADTLTRQLHANPANPPALLTEADAAIQTLRSGKPVAKVSAALMTLFRPSVQPYLMSWMKLEPAAMMAQLAVADPRVPTLILQGDRDLQVTSDDARKLSAAQPSAQLALIPGMNHVLVDAPADVAGNIATYNAPQQPLSAALLSTLTSFLKRTLSPPQ
ncbi:alpha/beta hydrolase [Deinococcus oregonensis]|uniref:Alpha/beta hydrolase n=1 Tax=Deinococcus oregonensis TaxID=1805970 RepID=A0ABV6B535_9DEIO